MIFTKKCNTFLAIWTIYKTGSKKKLNEKKNTMSKLRNFSRFYKSPRVCVRAHACYHIYTYIYTVVLINIGLIEKTERLIFHWENLEDLNHLFQRPPIDLLKPLKVFQLRQKICVCKLYAGSMQDIRRLLCVPNSMCSSNDYLLYLWCWIDESIDLFWLFRFFFYISH